MSTLTAARRALEAIPGLTWASWTADDLGDISTMLTAVEAVDEPSERHSLTELEEYLASTIYDVRRDCLLARDARGEVVAIARSIGNDGDRTVRRSLLMGAVRPDRRGQGIGRAILDWEIEHARAWYLTRVQPEQELLRISVFADAKARAEHRLAERAGLELVRHYAELTLHLTSKESAPLEVPGIELRPWESVAPEVVLAIRNAAFADHFGSVERPLSSWLEDQRTASFRPRWSAVAVDSTTGEVVGFLQASAYEQDWEPQGYTSGYIDLLGTLEDYRGRGIATALIRRALRAFQDAGLDAGELGVDSQNTAGAFGLYTGLGFQETSRTVQFMREERPTRPSLGA